MVLSILFNGKYKIYYKQIINKILKNNYILGRKILYFFYIKVYNIIS